MPRPIRASRETQFARAVLSRTLKVRPGENVIIEGWTHTLPWAVALARETRRLKAFPMVLFEDEDSFWDSVKSREDKILGAAPSHEWAALGKTDVYIHMWGAGDRLRMGELGDERAGKIIGFNPAWYAAASKAGVRGTRLEVGRPFPNLAKVYGVEEAKWMDQVVSGSMVDPNKLQAAGRPIAKALEKGPTVRIHDEKGTDVTLGLKHRAAGIADGRLTPKEIKRPFGMLSSLPSGVVRVALDESVADGTIVANRPSYFETGKAEGGVLTFEKGRLVSHHFDSGSEFFDRDYAKGGKGRDQPGRLSIGLNPKLHNTPQVEDIEAGAVLVSVGTNRFLNGKNSSPFFGFVVNVGASVEVDGRPLPLPS
ncbi:MAG TPA: aminopeptidase [Thermoplasmata archaeon]|nr:aminopeptidase [Thermoplasmata archaeon]